jgi:hypothetical protein
MATAWATRAAEYNAESARLLGWTTRAGGRYSSPGATSLPGPVSDWQQRAGIAVDGRIGPVTLRAMIAAAARLSASNADPLLDALDFERANPDAGTPRRRSSPPPPAPPPPTPPPPGVRLPAPVVATRTSRAPLVVGVLAAAGLVWYLTGRGRR